MKSFMYRYEPLSVLLISLISGLKFIVSFSSIIKCNYIHKYLSAHIFPDAFKYGFMRTEFPYVRK